MLLNTNWNNGRQHAPQMTSVGKRSMEMTSTKLSMSTFAEVRNTESTLLPMNLTISFRKSARLLSPFKAFGVEVFFWRAAHIYSFIYVSPITWSS